MMLQVLGEVHGGHPTTANLVVDGVAVGEGGAEAVEEVSHASAFGSPALKRGLGPFGARLERRSRRLPFPRDHSLKMSAFIRSFRDNPRRQVGHVVALRWPLGV